MNKNVTYHIFSHYFTFHYQFEKLEIFQKIFKKHRDVGPVLTTVCTAITSLKTCSGLRAVRSLARRTRTHQFESLIQGNATDMTKDQRKISAGYKLSKIQNIYPFLSRYMFLTLARHVFLFPKSAGVLRSRVIQYSRAARQLPLVVYSQ